MKTTRITIAALLAVALTGCASTEYRAYADAQIAVATARAEADKARYQALASIAQTGSDAARVAAVMSLQLVAPTQTPQMGLQAPKSTGETMLQWASVLLPTATQAYAIGKNASVQIESSRNAAATAQSTNATFLGIAGKIQAPGATSYSSTSLVSDSTHAPTVVTQPAPVVVRPADPVIVTQPDPVVVRPADPIVVRPADPVVVTQPAPVIVQPVGVQP